MCPAEEWSQLSTADKLSTLKDLYLSYYDRLYAFALKLTGDSDAADDVVQDLFLSIYSRGVEDLSIRTSVRGYLYGSVYNLSLLYIRRSSRLDRLSRITSEDASFDAEDNAIVDSLAVDNNLIDELSSRERKDAVIRAIESLPERQQLAFTLRWDGLEIKEIAETMAISVVAARKLIDKAVATISRSLKGIY